MDIGLNHIRLRGKMMIVYALSVFIPIVLTNVVFYQVTTHNVRQQKMHDMSNAMEQIRNDFLAQIDVAVGISSVLYTDSRLNEAIETSYEDALQYVESYNENVAPTLFRYSPIYKAVQNLTVYTDNETIVGGGGVQPLADPVLREGWYRALDRESGSSPVVYRSTIETYKGTETMYSVVRKLDYFKSQLHRKVLKIDISLDAINGLFDKTTLQGDLFLLNGRGEIEFATDPELEWRTDRIVYADTGAAASKDAIVFEQSFDNVHYLRDWRIVGVFPEHEVLRDVYNSRDLVLYLAIPNVVIPTLVIIWFTHSLNVRIVRILRHMKKVRNHHFETIDHKPYRDEIGQLTNEFNRMTLQIKNLIDDVYLADIQRKDLEIKRNKAQLHALQSQINPHFLFNALETIRMRSLMKKETETAKIIRNMAKIFRKSLAWERDWVTVREELELIRCFLEIQKYRFGDKLEYRIQVEERANDCLIPKMSILPFIENASIHGIEPLKEQGRIELDIRLKDRGRALAATVADNGVGIARERLAAIFAQLEKEESMGDHVGIRNVYFRLKMHYRDRFAFRLASEGAGGTRVSIELPLERMPSAADEELYFSK